LIKRRAFTTLELIFGIVIIGILAVIAIPKLSAIRSDAQGVVIANALSVCIKEAGVEYMKTGSFHGKTQEENATEACRKAMMCFSFAESDSNGSLEVTNRSSSLKKCIKAQDIAADNMLIGTIDVRF